MKYNNIITHSRSGKPIAARDKKKILSQTIGLKKVSSVIKCGAVRINYLQYFKMENGNG